MTPCAADSGTQGMSPQKTQHHTAASIKDSGRMKCCFSNHLGPFTSAVVYISHTVFLYWWKYPSL